MIKFKKGFNFKIISVLITVILFFNSTVYGIDLTNRTSLRVPLSGNLTEEKKRFNLALLYEIKNILGNVVKADKEKDLEFYGEIRRALLLEDGKILLDKDLYAEYASINLYKKQEAVQAIIHELTEALLQVIEAQNRSRYESIREIALNHLVELYRKTILGHNAYEDRTLVNDIWALIFEYKLTGITIESVQDDNLRAFLRKGYEIIDARGDLFGEEFISLYRVKETVLDGLKRGARFSKAASDMQQRWLGDLNNSSKGQESAWGEGIQNFGQYSLPIRPDQLTHQLSRQDVRGGTVNTALDDIQALHGFRARRLIERADFPPFARIFITDILRRLGARLHLNGVINLIRMGLNTFMNWILPLIDRFAETPGIENIITRLVLRGIHQLQRFTGALLELIAAYSLEQHGARVVAFSPRDGGRGEITDLVIRHDESGDVAFVEVQSGRQENEGRFVFWVRGQIDEHLLERINLTPAGRFEARQIEDLSVLPEFRVNENTQFIFVFNRQGWMNEDAISQIQDQAIQYINQRAGEDLGNRCLVFPIDMLDEADFEQNAQEKADELEKNNHAIEDLHRDVEQEFQGLIRSNMRRIFSRIRDLGIRVPQLLILELFNRFGFSEQNIERIESVFRTTEHGLLTRVLDNLELNLHSPALEGHKSEEDRLVSEAIEVLFSDKPSSVVKRRTDDSTPSVSDILAQHRECRQYL